MRILFVTTGLESGGAEMMLYKLLTRIDRSRFACSVVSLTDGGPVFGAKIRELGVPLEILGFKRGSPNPMMVPAVAKQIRAQKPDVVQTWMYHADLAGSLAVRLAGKTPVVWSVHGAIEDPSKLKRQTRLVIDVNRRVSRWKRQHIVYCSPTAKALHVRLGYPDDGARVISNGIDTDDFVPNPAARAALRDELGLSSDTPLIGFIARFDPQKDHETFFRAAALLRDSRPGARFLVCGSKTTADNKQLRQIIENAGVAEQTHLLGVRADIASVTAALDIAVSCSFSETFALTMAEAMSCGVPCVTTDLPAPVAVVGDVGWVFPARNPARLAEIWQEIMALPANKRGEWAVRARNRVMEHFSLDAMVDGYQRVYDDLGSIS